MPKARDVDNDTDTDIDMEAVNLPIISQKQSGGHAYNFTVTHHCPTERHLICKAQKLSRNNVKSGMKLSGVSHMRREKVTSFWITGLESFYISSKIS
jgi:hypothetical protein